MCSWVLMRKCGVAAFRVRVMKSICFLIFFYFFVISLSLTLSLLLLLRFIIQLLFSRCVSIERSCSHFIHRRTDLWSNNCVASFSWWMSFTLLKALELFHCSLIFLYIIFFFCFVYLFCFIDWLTTDLVALVFVWFTDNFTGTYCARLQWQAQGTTTIFVFISSVWMIATWKKK